MFRPRFSQGSALLCATSSSSHHRIGIKHREERTDGHHTPHPPPQKTDALLHLATHLLILLHAELNARMDSAKVKESVRAATTELVSKSKVLDRSKEEELPHFDLPEIKKGKRLGAGAFGVVWEINGVTLSPNYTKRESSRCVSQEPKRKGGDDDDDEDDDAILDAEARGFISRTCQREETNEARYAIKILHAELANDPDVFEKGCIDLAMEAQFLSNFVHPNIIKVRGAGCEALIGTKDYFLVMDRLYNTLEGKMEEWQATQKKLGMFSKKDAKNAFLRDRLNVAFELSSALNYMHSRK